jgi:type I restriction enzyme R subunit
MRQALLNENADLARQNPRYIMRITGDDAKGTAQLSNFIDPRSDTPGYCHHLTPALHWGRCSDLPPVVGRGTRVHEDTLKCYFTLIDFRKAINYFADPDFDGEPVQIYEPGEDDPVTPPDDALSPNDDGDAPIPPVPGEDETIVYDPTPPDITLPSGIVEPPIKYYIKGEPVTMLAERVEYHDENGASVTESLHDYNRKTIRRHYASLDQFLHSWQAAERKEAIITELAEEGLLLDLLLEEIGKELDPFDLICHIAFDQPPLTHHDRVANVRKRDVFEDAYNYMKSGQLMRQVINRISSVDFNDLAERKHFGDIYEQLLNDLQSAGNAGEYYTPRAVTACRRNSAVGRVVMRPVSGAHGL